tara:strand:+ start:40 stop:741 length:702 start_codon:yes stop_codon:yes gene_type:complete
LALFSMDSVLACIRNDDVLRQASNHRAYVDREHVERSLDECTSILREKGIVEAAVPVARMSMALCTMHDDEHDSFLRLIGLYLVVMADHDVMDIHAPIRDYAPAMETPLRRCMMASILELAATGSATNLLPRVIELAKTAVECMAWWDMGPVVRDPVSVLTVAKAFACWLCVHDDCWADNVHLWDEALAWLRAETDSGSTSCGYCGEEVDCSAGFATLHGRLFCDEDCQQLSK